MTSLASSFKADKDKTGETLNQQTARLHATQMELTLTQHRSREAGLGRGTSVVDSQQLDAAISRFGSHFQVRVCPTGPGNPYWKYLLRGLGVLVKGADKF